MFAVHSGDGFLSQFQDDKQGSESNNGVLAKGRRCGIELFSCMDLDEKKDEKSEKKKKKKKK